MAGSNRSPGSNQPSIKYRWNQSEGASSKLADFLHEENASSLSDINKQSKRQSKSNSSDILSTTEFVAAVGQIWSYARHPLAVSQPKVNTKEHDIVHQKEGIFSDRITERDIRVPNSANNKDYPVDINTSHCSSNIVQPNLKLLGISQKILAFEPLSNTSTSPFLQMLMLISTNMPHESCKVKGLESARISCGLGNAYGWMSQLSSSVAKDSSSISNVDNNEEDASVSTIRSSTSSPLADYCLNMLASCNNAFEESNCRIGDDELCENKSKQLVKFVTGDNSKGEICTLSDKPHYAFAKQEHAIAGALAGICVSLCLHPVDTVKTVIQSCRADQRSLFCIGRSIISERGLSGLYRGITSKIASSAPISAVYTFTYESVKENLLPFYAKEQCSLLHCIAGGCASFMTSFIYTPSEHIKQQMQLGSHYQSCWKALVGIIRIGGLHSLYAGWAAVLCRNVPHSIIKFYAYESLKQLVSSSSASANILQTVVCGGLAGSAAALFTTPFDVVKTRLQTQMPGSASQYDSVFLALQEISKHEGLKGLYRGLAPRLVMYMSQGALFFVSYESFKLCFL